LTSPHNSYIKNETRVLEAEGIFKTEVPDNVRKIVIVKAQDYKYLVVKTIFNELYQALNTNKIMKKNIH
jgi:hypothetical protein